jgi:hypothetical protein
LEAVEALLVIVAAFFLWKMSKLAPGLFLIEFVISAVAALYLVYISPSKGTAQLRQHDNKVIVFGLCLAFTLEIFRLWYAWWVTSDRHLRSGINFSPTEGRACP